MKYKKEGIKSQIEDLKVTEYFFKITGTVVLVGASIALVKENGLTLETNLGDTLSTIGPSLAALSGGALLGLAPTFKKEATNLKQKLNHQEILEQQSIQEENTKLKKRHFI